MLPDEIIIRQVRIHSADPIQLLRLPRGKNLSRIDTAGGLHQAPPKKNLVNTRNTPGKIMSHIKESPIHIGNLLSQCQYIGTDGLIGKGHMPQPVKKTDSRGSPDAPVSEKSSDNSQSPSPAVFTGEAPGREKVKNNIIIIPRI
jgi:hypothetical protein